MFLQIIKAPIITEKNTLLQGQGVYTFEVDRKASKPKIRKAVESAFNVKVSSVRTSICRGRARQGRFGTTRVKYWKKAFVKLAVSEKISLFEGA